MWYIYIYIYMQWGYYSVIKKNEIILFAGKWIELEIIMLSEIIQIPKDRYCTFSLICKI
jgi:hypothetical protein